MVLDFQLTEMLIGTGYLTVVKGTWKSRKVKVKIAIQSGICNR